MIQLKAMPKNKKAWCSWNSSMKKDEIEKNSITYWLNLLQNLKCDENIFLTLNPYFKIDEKKILKKVRFTILYCGSYFGYGFHEDGIKSSIEMLKTLND